MKKLLLLLLITPLISLSQSYEEEKTELIEKIQSWGDKKAFEIYKDLVINVQDKSTNVANAMYPDPYDYSEAYDKEKELLKEYKLKFIKKYKKEGMSENMILALDIYGTKKKWFKNFKNLYNQ